MNSSKVDVLLKSSSHSHFFIFFAKESVPGCGILFSQLEIRQLSVPILPLRPEGYVVLFYGKGSFEISAKADVCVCSICD